MKLTIIIAVSVILGVSLLIGIIALIGARLPREHVASRSLLLHKTQLQVYTVVRDVGSMPAWRADIKRVDLETQSDGRLHFREDGKQGSVNYELVEDIPGQRMITRIVDKDLGYSGKWTYVLASEDGATRLTITENGEVSNVLFRFMSRYVFGHTATLDSYLTSLANHLGESAAPY
jgi:hypothetical protein